MNLKQLSDMLGLSQTTVSRALNGYPEVSEHTRLRVQAAARSNNYSPNARAKGLATGRAFSIGHVIPISETHEMINPIFGDFIAGAGETYSLRGYDMTMAVVTTETELDTYRTMHARSSVDGVVVHAPRMNDPRIALLRELGMPFVVHGRSSNEVGAYSWVDVNNTSAFRRATEFLLDLGHRRIALVNGLETMDFADRRRKGYEAALKSRAVTPDPALMRSSDMTEGLGYTSVREMLAMDTPPTAVLTASLITAFGVRRAIEEAGLVMGRDISVVSYDDDLGYLRNDGDVPVFTATRSSVRDAGRTVADILLRKIEAADSGHETRMLETELIAGQSTGPVSTGPLSTGPISQHAPAAQSSRT